MDIVKIGIIGTGTMGSGIAQNVLSNGYNVKLIGHKEADLKMGIERLNSGFDKAIAKGSITKDQKALFLSNLETSLDYEVLKDADLVIEAVTENIEVKKDVILNIEKHTRKDAIIATNTSSISITALASLLGNPERFLGIHFFNPASVMKVVELVKGEKTSNEALSKARTFAKNLGKTVVDVKDSPGFVSNRILMLFINESIHILEEGIATKEGIDTVAKLGFNHPMGPLELADFIGLDVCRDIMEAIYRQGKDERFKPAELLKKLVNEGNNGRKSGKGFYEYKKQK
ncbi:MAG: 3-hydroxyacyl-CoA dehydrogenase family protein [Candidatus Marsarchaeota archaeon]|nr:3-hydroxyacyl-CoA dehydrogenase family protein [Candidatus Marsarchaeota archaeon]